MSQETNPYESPQTVDAPLTFSEKASLLSRTSRGVLWTIVFVANLVIPVAFGWQFTDREAKIGAGIATVIFYGLGLYASLTSARHFRAITVGGILVALTQFFPIMQFILGLVAHGLVERMGYTSPTNWDPDGTSPSKIAGVLGGMMMTILTGGPLILIAVAIGALATKRWRR